MCRFLKSVCYGLAVLILPFVYSSAYAAAVNLIDSDTFLSDRQSELDWLDVTLSVDMSVNDVTAQFTLGGQFEGWRYASLKEFNALINHVSGDTLSGLGYTAQAEGNMDQLLMLLGSTLDSYYQHYYGQSYDASFGYQEGDGVDFTYGYLSDQDFAVIWDDDRSVERGIDYVNTIFRSSQEASKNTGSFLVRSSLPVTVPEPSMFLLLAAVFAGIAWLNKTSLSTTCSKRS